MAAAHDPVTDRQISDYLTGAVRTGLIKGINMRSTYASFGGFGGAKQDFYLIQASHGDVIEYDRDGILKYVEMLKSAGVEPRSIF